MTTEFNIRPATPDDLEVITEFNAALAAETEHVTLDPTVLRAGVKTALESAEICHYFVAELNSQIVGQCMITFEWTDWRNGWLWWFQSVYVRPDHRRAGVFRALYHHVLEAAQADPTVRGLRLYVEKDNARAMHSYQALGMTPSGHLVYELDWSNAKSY